MPVLPPRKRKQVRSFVLLDFSPEHIAKIVGCPLAELEEHFGEGLWRARYEILASALERTKELATQRRDLRVALDASRLLDDKANLRDLASQTDDLAVAYEACHFLLTGELP